MTTPRFMTKDECDKKVHIPRWTFNLMLAILSLFVILVGMAAASSQNAAYEAREAARATTMVGSALETHKEVEIERDKGIINSIQALRIDLRAYHEDQKELIKTVIELRATTHNHDTN